MSLLSPVVSRAQQDDVAEAARQEKARKEAAAKKSRHVYTNEDLQKKEILDDQDRAAVEARKKQIAPAPAVAPAPGADSEQAAQPAESLGEVARRYRAEREAREAEAAQRKQLSQFPMDIAPQVLARPVLPAEDARKSPILAPKFETPRGGKIRDPFSRSEVPSRKEILPAVPAVAVVPKAIIVVPAAPKSVSPVVPSAPKANIAPKQTAPNKPDVAGTITVKAGDSLWKISREQLGAGSRWQELVAANPNLTAPTRVLPGTVLSIPVASNETVKQQNSASSRTIQKGDSLWKIALNQYGQGSSWTCLAQANPTLRNPNAIFPGQTLVLPASCTLRR